MNHIFVDYENVRNVDLAIFGMPDATITLLLGPHNRSLDVEIVEKLIAHSTAVELVRLAKAGRNAVDFALAYYLGRKVASEPAASFHLVSKDAGYDPLIAHLQSRKVRVRRYLDFTALTEGMGAAPGACEAQVRPRKASGARSLPKTNGPAPAQPNLLQDAVDFLHRNKNRPKRRKTLVNHLQSHFRKVHPAPDIEALLLRMEAAGQLQIAPNGAVTYHVDGAAA